MTMRHRVLVVLSVLVGGGIVALGLAVPNAAWDRVAIVAAIFASLPWALFYLGIWLGASRWNWRKISIVILVLLFAWFIWPTPYKHVGSLMQVNRFTGTLCRVGSSCW